MQKFMFFEFCKKVKTYVQKPLNHITQLLKVSTTGKSPTSNSLLRNADTRNYAT